MIFLMFRLAQKITGHCGIARRSPQPVSLKIIPMQEDEEGISLRGVGIKVRGEDDKEILLLSQRRRKKYLMADLIPELGIRWGLEEISELLMKGTTRINAVRIGWEVKKGH